MYLAGDFLEKLCRGTEINGVGIASAGGLVVTWDLLLEGYSVTQLILYSLFCTRTLSLLSSHLPLPSLTLDS